MYRFPISRFVISVLAVCLLPLATQARGKDKGEFKLTPDRKLLMAEQVIERFYVDSVDAGNMVQDAIVAMLKTLDPPFVLFRSGRDQGAHHSARRKFQRHRRAVQHAQ